MLPIVYSRREKGTVEIACCEKQKGTVQEIFGKKRENYHKTQCGLM
jgi:hypothetical protein